MNSSTWRVFHPEGDKRVVVTKELPGERWLDILKSAGCRVEICTSAKVLSLPEIIEAVGSRCDGAIGQLTEPWGDDLFRALKRAGASAYSNYAVGFNNVDLKAATRNGIPVGNTPGVLTETTAQMAVALTFAAARRVCEAERYLRRGDFKGWLPTLFTGSLLWRKTAGIVGAGRIGEAYARMMVEGHKMNLIYYDLQPNAQLENRIAAYNRFLTENGEDPVSCRRAADLDELLAQSDCVSIHTILDASTHHLIDAKRLQLMKEDAVLVNTSRGPVINEADLVAHCRRHPDFHAGLDVFENEPDLHPGLDALDNVVAVPHIASATRWTREGMAVLAASNVAAVILGHPAWNRPDISPFLEGSAPPAAPSIVNAVDLGMPLYAG